MQDQMVSGNQFGRLLSRTTWLTPSWRTHADKCLTLSEIVDFAAMLLDLLSLKGRTGDSKDRKQLERRSSYGASPVLPVEETEETNFGFQEANQDARNQSRAYKYQENAQTELLTGNQS